MFKKIIIAVIAAVIVFLVYSATRPDTFRVERTVSIKASPEKIYALINDFHKWTLWSPYEKMETEMERTYSGAAKGNGAVYEWLGEKTGSGRMEITETVPARNIVIKLDFTKPMQAHNTAEFILMGTGDVTEVTWAMYGPQPYMMKVMHIFFNMDKMVGKDFESGLMNLKIEAEK